uniref:(northern house mosquito) hypothetical protein n=1 Tax=Culex pipiens TaxID=7175 RepID=A0A8D8AZJ4_CULPI
MEETRCRRRRPTAATNRGGSIGRSSSSRVQLVRVPGHEEPPRQGQKGSRTRSEERGILPNARHRTARSDQEQKGRNLRGSETRWPRPAVGHALGSATLRQEPVYHAQQRQLDDEWADGRTNGGGGAPGITQTHTTTDSATTFFFRRALLLAS